MDLPSGWVETEIATIADVLPGYGFPMKRQGRSSGKYPFYKVSDISQSVQQGNVYLTFCKNFVDDVDLVSLGATPLPAGTVVMAKIGEAIKLNRRAILSADALIDNNIVGVKAKTEIPNKIIYYFFLFVRLAEVSQATTVPSVRKADIERMIIKFPPLAEQHRIVEKIDALFSELDKGVEYLQTIKQQLRTYRRSVLKSAFTFKRGWTKKRVTDIGTVQLGRQRSPKHVSKDYPTKYLRAANIKDTGLDLSNILEMDFSPNERTTYQLQDKDIVLSEASGSPSQVCKPAIWRGELPLCCFQNTVIRHRLTEGTPEFIYWQYVYLYQTGFFANMVNGVGINHMGAKRFANIELHVAPAHEQYQIVQKIESRLSVCDKLDQLVDQNLFKAEALRQSILKKAFEGRLVPQDPNDEPAEKLLERIRVERATQTSPARRRRNNA